ncbi:hypothetical protein ACI65C_013546 [Semiaphis heraclei]
MTNWTRHILSCKKKNSSGQSIISFFKQKPSTSSTDIVIGLNDKIHTKNADMLETEDNILSNSNSATHDVPKIEGLNDEINIVSSDVLEIEDDILSSSNNAKPDLPKIEVFENDPASIPLVISDEVLHYYISLCPCQPITHDLLNNTFPKTYKKKWSYKVRLRRKKMMAGEQARDELTINPEDNFRTDVFYRILSKYFIN